MNKLLELYNLLIIVFIGASAILLIVRPFKNRLKKLYSLTVIFVFLLITIPTYLTMNYFSEKHKKQAEIDLKNELIESEIVRSIHDSELAKLKEQNKKDSLLKYIHSYYEAYCDNDKQKLKNFYKYPMSRYYTCTNVSEEKVQERRNFEGHPKSWGNSHCIFNDEKATITKIGKDSVEVSIELKKISEDVFYTTIELNKDWKIYSIMNTKRIVDEKDSVKVK